MATIVPNNIELLKEIITTSKGVPLLDIENLSNGRWNPTDE
jgi:hypothetical protein